MRFKIALAILAIFSILGAKSNANSKAKQAKSDKLSQKKEVTLDFIKKSPEGIARDFYIFHFINQAKTSKESALEAYSMSLHKTQRLQDALAKKVPLKLLPREMFCKRLSFSDLMLQDNSCIQIGLRLDNVLKLGKKEISDLDKKLESKNLKEIVQILSKANDKKEEIFNATPAQITQIFNSLTRANKLKFFSQIKQNSKITSKITEALNSKIPAFDRIIAQIIHDNDFEEFQKILLDLDISRIDANFNAYFLLGLNEVLNPTNEVNKKRASKFFALAQNSAKSSFHRDRATFWRYLMTNENEILEELNKSNNPNIFSIYASFLLNKQPNFDISTIKSKNKKAKIEIENPFIWQEIKANLRNAQSILKNQANEEITDTQNNSDALKNAQQTFQNLLQKLDSKQTLPHLVYAKNLQENYTKNYFIFAYDELKLWDDKLDKAFNYAVARQESQLIPAVISHSYALGMMQIMFFNVPDFAKQISQNSTKKLSNNLARSDKNSDFSKTTEFDMFNPKTALTFGKFYLDKLKDQFKSPLFAAYAYNAGPTFLRKLLKRGHLFVKNREFEPWISMEQIPYEETRFYGMHVIANYVIYAKLQGIELDLTNLLEEVLINERE